MYMKPYLLKNCHFNFVTKVLFGNRFATASKIGLEFKFVFVRIFQNEAENNVYKIDAYMTSQSYLICSV